MNESERDYISNSKSLLQRWFYRQCCGDFSLL